MKLRKLNQTQLEELNELRRKYTIVFHGEKPKRNLDFLYQYFGYDKLKEVLAYIDNNNLQTEEKIEKAKALGYYNPPRYLFAILKNNKF
jgi:hypothetical protein